MNAETRAPELDAEPAELVDAAGLLSLAIDGLVGMSFEITEWRADAMRFGARLVLDRAENIAAVLEGRETRWSTGPLPEAAASEPKKKPPTAENAQS